MNEQKENIVKEYLNAIGDDISREGLKDTPKRIVKMWDEIFKGYDKDKEPKVTVFPNNGDGIHCDQMIIDTGYFYTFCEHHFLPFMGTYYFAYIPDQTVLGLSKVARVVDYHSSRLQVQERLTKEIVDQIQSAVNPLGVALVLKGRHLCKEMRGIKMINGEMTTSDLRGVFRDKPEARQEFMRFIN